MKVNKNGKEYPLGFMPEHYPADRVYLDGDTSKTVQSEIDNIDWYFMRSDVTTSGSYESYSLQSGRTFSEFDMLQFTFFLDNWIVGTAFLRRGDFTGVTGINIVGYYDVSTPIEFSVKYESDTSFQVKHSTTQSGTKKMSVVGIKL